MFRPDFSKTLYKFSTAQFQLTLQVRDEDCSYRDDFSFDDTLPFDDVKQKIESGELRVFESRFVLTHKPSGLVLSESYFSGCVAGDEKDFFDCFRDQGKAYEGFRHMVREAVALARVRIDNLQSVSLREGASLRREGKRYTPPV